MVSRPSPDLPPPALSQSRLYADVLRHMGRGTLTLPLGTIGLARLVLRSLGPFGALGLIPGGVQWCRSSGTAEQCAALATLPALARAHGVRALLCNTTSPEDEKIFEKFCHLPVLTGGFHAALDISLPTETRRRALHQKWRNRLSQAEKSGLTVSSEPLHDTRHTWLFRTESAQRSARSYRALPLAFTRTWARIAPDATRLFTAWANDAPIAAMLFLLHEGAATYHIGVTTDQGRAVNAHGLLLWEASNWLNSHGFSRLDLGPVDTEINPGLARFKLGSGARASRRGATMLHTRTTAPLGWLNRTAVRAVARQTGPSCR